MEGLRILIVEDDAIIADDIKNCLTELGHSAIGPAHKLESARKLLENTRPQLALLDIHLENHMDGISLAEWMLIHRPVPVIFLTAFSDEITLSRAKAVHPAYYLIKPFDRLQLKIAIEIAGSNYYETDNSQLLSRRLYKLNRQLSCPLSSRELEVVKYLAEGMSNIEIAGRLFVSEHTVKSHLKNIFLKTESRSRTDLISRIVRS